MRLGHSGSDGGRRDREDRPRTGEPLTIPLCRAPRGGPPCPAACGAPGDQSPRKINPVRRHAVPGDDYASPMPGVTSQPRLSVPSDPVLETRRQGGERAQSPHARQPDVHQDRQPAGQRAVPPGGQGLQHGRDGPLQRHRQRDHQEAPYGRPRIPVRAPAPAPRGPPRAGRRRRADSRFPRHLDAPPEPSPRRAPSLSPACGAPAASLPFARPWVVRWSRPRGPQPVRRPARSEPGGDRSSGAVTAEPP